MDKYMQMNIDTSTIRDLDRDGGLPADDLAKMVTPDYVINQCEKIEKGEKENERI